MEAEAKSPRSVCMVLSARSLSYAYACLSSLFRSSLESLSMTLITDGPEDVETLTQAMEKIAPGPRHCWKIVSKVEADIRAADYYAGRPQIQKFREGHPCWRKVTDPQLFGEEGQELVILDPDVYFPNPFRFEATPATGLLLMWQEPNCLYPPEVVRTALDAGIRMADHTDIGVCQMTTRPDRQWLDWLIGRIGGDELPRSMHVESIVWAALAMQVGGGYLDPRAWICWNNSVWRRLRARMGTSGPDLLRAVPLAHAKCLHAGGTAKSWLVSAEEQGILPSGPAQEAAYAPVPYREYFRSKFDRKHMVRGIARKLGAYKILGQS